VAEKGRGGCAAAVIKFLFRFYAICVPALAGRRGREEEEDLMMMYRGRATERREKIAGGCCSLYDLSATKEEFKYQRREKRELA